MTFKQAMFISTAWRTSVMVLEQLPGRINEYNKIAHNVLKMRSPKGYKRFSTTP
jgi:hypothetical protein